MNIANFFAEVLKPLKYGEETKSYIVGVLSEFKDSRNDLSKNSITLLYAQARQDFDFKKFQSLADWTLFYCCLFESNQKDYYIDIGRLSYYSCYRILNKQWLVFEDIADNMSNIVKETKYIIHNNQNHTEKHGFYYF